MSYVEHGPRMFLTNRSNTGMSFSYGNHILPRKRSEGRLKLYESCLDLRAWSPSSSDSSRHVRELIENVSVADKIIPANVLIDNIIGFTSKAQDELHTVKKELQKYKTLKLTSEQEEQIRNYKGINTLRENQRLRNTEVDASSQSTSLDFDRLNLFINSNSYISLKPDEIFSSNNFRFISTNKRMQLFPCPLNGNFNVNPLLDNNFDLVPILKPKSLLIKELSTDSSKKPQSCTEYIDSASQVKQETCEAETQTDLGGEFVINAHVVESEKSQLFVQYESERESSYTGTDNCDEEIPDGNLLENEDADEVESQWELRSGTTTIADYKIPDNEHREIIIAKDSEIISLKTELCVKEAELEELRDANKSLDDALKDKEADLSNLRENLKTYRDNMMRIDRERIFEIEELRKKLSACNYLVEQLKDDLNRKSRTCYLQSQEIETLQLYAKEVTILRIEKDSLKEKLKEMEQFKIALSQRDELKKQNQEQSCILADQEDEINRLLLLIKQMSVTYNQKTKIEENMNSLQTEIKKKDLKISQYEDRLLCIEQEISDFFNNLRNNFEDFNEIDLPSDENSEFNITKEANNLLDNLNAMVTRLRSYKIEREGLLQQIASLKDVAMNNKIPSTPNRYQHFDIASCNEALKREPLEQQVDATKENGIILLNINENNDVMSDKEVSTSVIRVETEFNSIDSETSLSAVTSSVNTFELKNECLKCNVKLGTNCSADEIEKEIVQHVSESLIKMQYLTQKLEVYIESERPSLIKQMQNVQDTLRDAELAITSIQDITFKKSQISELYNRCKENRIEWTSNTLDLSCDLCAMQVKVRESIEAILYQQLQDIRQVEIKNFQDQRIDQALEMYLKTCIYRINTTLQDVGDQKTQITTEITKQQQQIVEKNTEIARLREEIAQRGEGDHVRLEEIKRQETIKNQLLKATMALAEKDELVLELQKQIKLIQGELRTCTDDRNAVKKQNKNLINIKNKLIEECEEYIEEMKMKNKEINNLSEKLGDLNRAKHIVSVLEEKTETMGCRLTDLQFENDELRCKIASLNEIVTEKDQTITELKISIDRNNNTFVCKVAEYKSEIEQKQNEIVELQNENRQLTEKLKEIEKELLKTNATILSLTAENDKINLIHALQRDISKLDKSEKELKSELNNLKAALTNDQSTNRMLEKRLDEYLCENEKLKLNVDYWRNENSYLLNEIQNEMILIKSKEDWHYIPEKICEKISSIKNQLYMQHNSDTQKVQQNVNNDKNILIDKLCLVEEAESVMDEDHGKWKILDKLSEVERKETEIKDINEEMDRNNKIVDNDPLNPDPDYYSLLCGSDISRDRISRIKYRLKDLENKNRQQQNEIKQLLEVVKSRDLEINNLMESINSLVQEKNDLSSTIKNQADEYQDKLTVIKKNYDRSLSALCERHKESIETLQIRFEDVILNEGHQFDPEKWLQSLSLKELVNVHERICMFTWCTLKNNEADIIRTENKYSLVLKSDTEENRSYNHYESDEELVPVTCVKQTSDDLIPLEIKESCNLQLQNDASYDIKSQTGYSKKRTASIKNHNSTIKDRRKTLNSQSRSTKQKLQQDLECEDRSHTVIKCKNEKKKQTTRTDPFDKQRWSFINQCSMFHNLTNLY